jgi:hypothetical protein
MRKQFFCVALASLAVLSASVGAAITCVSSGNGLRNALIAAASNGEDDEIRLQWGTFSVSSGAAAFTFDSGESHNLVIKGGYQPGLGGTCGPQTGDAATSVLSGSNARQVLVLGGDPGAAISVTISNFTIRDGQSAAQGAGLKFGGASGFAGNLAMERVILDNNTSTSFGGGAAISSDGGIVSVRGNLFMNNQCGSNQCAATVTVNADNLTDLRVYFVNNTIVSNGCSAGASGSCTVGGLRYGGSARATFLNNLFALNSAADMQLQNVRTAFAHNNMLSLIGQLPTENLNPLAIVDPLFVASAGNNYRLHIASPLRNAGATAVGGALPFLDLDLQPRVHENVVDVGAYENHDVLFADGFE